MSTVIGLFPSNKEIGEELKKMRESGFSEENISLITKEGPINKLLGLEPNKIVAEHAATGALFGIAIYGIFVLVAVWCDCLLYPLSQLIAFEIILVGILCGALFGGIIGFFIGLAEYEKDTHLYTQGVKIGEKVFALYTDKRNIDKAVNTLTQIGCQGVQVLPE